MGPDRQLHLSQQANTHATLYHHVDLDVAQLGDKGRPAHRCLADLQLDWSPHPLPLALARRTARQRHQADTKDTNSAIAAIDETSRGTDLAGATNGRGGSQQNIRGTPQTRTRTRRSENIGRRGRQGRRRRTAIAAL